MVDNQKSLAVIASHNENSISFVLLACAGSKKYCIMYRSSVSSRKVVTRYFKILELHILP